MRTTKFLVLAAVAAMAGCKASQKASSETKTVTYLPDGKVDQYFFYPSLYRDKYIEMRKCDPGADLQVDPSELQGDPLSVINELMTRCNPQPGYGRVFHRELIVSFFEGYLTGKVTLPDGPLKQKLDRFKSAPTDPSRDADAINDGNILVAIRVREEMIARIQQQLDQMNGAVPAGDAAQGATSANPRADALRQRLANAEEGLKKLEAQYKGKPAGDAIDTAAEIRSALDIAIQQAFDIGAPIVVNDPTTKDTDVTALLYKALAEYPLASEALQLGGPDRYTPLTATTRGDILYFAGRPKPETLFAYSLFTKKSTPISASKVPEHLAWKKILFGYDFTTVGVQQAQFRNAGIKYVVTGKKASKCTATIVPTEGAVQTVVIPGTDIECNQSYMRAFLGHQLSFDGKFFQLATKSNVTFGRSDSPVFPTVMSGPDASPTSRGSPSTEKNFFSLTLAETKDGQFYYGCRPSGTKAAFGYAQGANGQNAGFVQLPEVPVLAPVSCFVGTLADGILVWGKAGDPSSRVQGFYKTDLKLEGDPVPVQVPGWSGEVEAQMPFFSLPDGRVLVTQAGKEKQTTLWVINADSAPKQ